MPKFTEQLEADLCAAVGAVLRDNGMNDSEWSESDGWTPEMAASFAAFMQKQIEQITVPA